MCCLPLYASLFRPKGKWSGAKIDLLTRHLKEALVYAQVTPLTKEAVYFVFAHRKQLDFGSVLGPNGQIMLHDSTIIEVLRAHVRAEAITDLSFQPTFSAFESLRQFLQSYWIPLYDDGGFPSRPWGPL